MQKLQWNSLQINANLTHKYDIHFNFFLTKPITEMVYNHTHAVATIAFKDAVIFADNNQYLKRYYFLKNALDKDQIFDRINLLAEFYGNAVLLRYEYPLMILTRTKSIFQKRLKRMKKILAEQGSSDQSKSSKEQKVISIDSSRFLKSVDSSELQKKSVDDENNIQLDFSLFKETQYEVYDIFEENQSKNSKISQSSFSIINLAQNIAQELILEADQKQDELKHLMVDFDDLDQEDIIRKYQRIIQKQNCRQSVKQSTIRRQDSIVRSINSKNPLKIRDLMEKKPMASSITITALEDHMPGEPSSSNNIDKLKKKSMLSPSRMESPVDKQKNLMKRSSYYQYETVHHNFGVNNKMIIAQDQMEDSPGNNQKIMKKFPSMDQQDFNLYNNQKRVQNSTNKHLNLIQPQTSRQNFRDKGERNYGSNSPIMKYSSFLNQQQKIRQRSEFSNLQGYQQGQRYSSLPFRGAPQDFDFKRNEKYNNNNVYEGNAAQNRFGNVNQPPNRMTSINININNLQEKKEPHRVNVKFNNSKNKYPLGQNFAEEQRNYRAQKKRKIRQKAAALLNRVKSQQYMRTGFDAYDKQYGQNGDIDYFERYY